MSGTDDVYSYVCDLTDEKAVAKVVKQIQEEVRSSSSSFRAILTPRRSVTRRSSSTTLVSFLGSCSST